MRLTEARVASQLVTDPIRSGFATVKRSYRHQPDRKRLLFAVGMLLVLASVVLMASHNDPQGIGVAGLFLGWSASIPSIGTAVQALMGEYPVKAYGAVGDGTTDDTTAITNATTAAGSAGTVRFSALTYLVSALVDLTASVTWVGAGRGKTTIYHAVNSADFLHCAGTKGGNLTVASNVAAQASTVVLSDASTLTAGDYILISSTLAWPNGSSGVKYGEIARVKSIATNTLTLYASVDEAYATANTAVVNKLTMLQGPRVQGITFKGVTNSGGYGALSFTYCRDVLIDDCEFRNLDGPAVQPNSCVDWTVRNSSFRDLTDNTGAGRLGYGVNANAASRDGRVQGCYFENCRHGFTTNGSSEGVPRHVTIADCIGRGMSSSTFDTHEDSRYITFANCIADGSPSSGGFKTRCPDTTYTGCVSVGCDDSGLLIASTASRTRVNGGSFDSVNTSSSAILVQGPDSHLDGVTVPSAGSRCVLIKTSADRTTINGGVFKSPTANTCIEIQTVADTVINAPTLESSTKGIDNVSGTTVTVNGYTLRTITTPLTGTIVARLPIDQKGGQTGLIVPRQTGMWGPTAQSVVSATQYWGRFVLSEDLTITKLGFYVVNAGSAAGSDTVDVGIFASDSTTAIVSGGSTASKLNAAGFQTLTVSSTRLKANTIYYASIICTIASLGSFTIGTAASGIAAAASNTFGSSVGQIEFGKLASVGPALSTSGISAASSSVPLIWLLES